MLEHSVDGRLEWASATISIEHDFDESRVPVPPLAEQTAIAAFLDRETAKIDALVAEQRRLIELLKEKRQAVISHAVTKGLNPHAPMKPPASNGSATCRSIGRSRRCRIRIDTVSIDGTDARREHYVDEGGIAHVCSVATCNGG